MEKNHILDLLLAIKPVEFPFFDVTVVENVSEGTSWAIELFKKSGIALMPLL